MPKREKRSEREVHAMIISDAKIRIGCADFAPEFTLYHIELTSYPRVNWDVHSARNVAWSLGEPSQ